MIRFLVKRLATGIIVMWLVTMAIYGMFFVGSPKAIARRLAGRNATQDTVDRIYHNLGLDQAAVAAVPPLRLAVVEW